jgi:hypothetical protein
LKIKPEWLMQEPLPSLRATLKEADLFESKTQ